MIENDDKEFDIEFTDKLKLRALELLDESQAMQFAEGVKLSGAMGSVLLREQARIERKYGADHPRTREMALRLDANTAAKTAMYARYTEASTPRAESGSGWSVDGFVRTSDGSPAADLTVAAYDSRGVWYRDFGYSCTDENGYFKLVVDKLSETDRHVFIHASYKEKLLKSNVNELIPESGKTDRVEIIIDDGSSDDCSPPEHRGKGTMPPSSGSESGYDKQAGDIADEEKIGIMPTENEKDTNSDKEAS